jgi:hypothetical protein
VSVNDEIDESPARTGPVTPQLGLESPSTSRRRHIKSLPQTAAQAFQTPTKKLPNVPFHGLFGAETVRVFPGRSRAGKPELHFVAGVSAPKI